jgi:hypothetical protein
VPGYTCPFQIPLKDDTNFLLLGLFGIRQRSFESVNLLDQIHAGVTFRDQFRFGVGFAHQNGFQIFIFVCCSSSRNLWVDRINIVRVYSIA